MHKLLYATVTAVALLTVPTSSAQSESVKVRLFAGTNPTGVTIIPESSPLTLLADRDHEPLASISPPDSVLIARGPIDLRTVAGSLQINLPELVVRSEPGGAFLVQVRDDAGRTTERRFSGQLHISTDAQSRRITILNEVDRETYVAAVVAKEYDLDDGEGARAMAIVARTFISRAAREGDGTASDGLAAQVFRGVDVITEASREAAESTRGLILTYDNAPIVAVYSASNGGHSASNADVWSGEPLPYLRARRDRYDRAASPHSNWSFEASVTDVHELLAPKFGTGVEKVTVGERSSDGRVGTVDIRTTDGGTEPMNGNEFRMLVSRKFGATSLRSTRFEMKRRGDNYEFKGSGFGHGVGLSQWGAHEMAKRGYNHQEILSHYYPGTELTAVESAGERPIPAFAENLRPATAEDREERSEPIATADGTLEPRLIGWTRAASEAPRAPRAKRNRPGW
ncbi:MAG: SpoIID/LytB domain-containing protein [Rhodothermia bacterium]|nr:SpoIID/LytB domain-containing protein [Rhodothermia bacterium]